jgi:toxin ParE1/3/4
MKRGYIFSREAERSLYTIRDYTIEQWGIRKAKTYVAAIYRTIAILCEEPGRGHAREDVPPPYLVKASGRHLIIYRSDARSVYILNILHDAMQIGAHIEHALIYETKNQSMLH